MGGHRAVVDDALEILIRDASEKMDAITTLDLEPFTQNYHYFQALCDKFTFHYRKMRRKSSSSDIKYRPVLSSTVPATRNQETQYNYYTEQEYFAKCREHLNNFGIIVNKVDDLLPLLPSDPYDEELKIMAAVHAYFKVSKVLINLCSKTRLMGPKVCFKVGFQNYGNAIDVNGEL